MIDLKPEYRDQIKKILHEYASGCETRIFGSRVQGKAGKWSDIDLVLIPQDKLDWRKLEKIKQAFSDSDLPISVDVHDWHTLPEHFRKAIQEKSEIL